MIDLHNTRCDRCYGRGWLFPFISYMETPASPLAPTPLRQDHRYPIRCRCHPEYLTGDPVSITINLGGQQIEFCPAVDIATLKALIKDGAIKRLFYCDEERQDCINYAISVRAYEQHKRAFQHEALERMFDDAMAQKICEVVVYRLLNDFDFACTPPAMVVVHDRGKFEPEIILETTKGRALLHICVIQARTCCGWGVHWAFPHKPAESASGGTDYIVPCVFNPDGSLFQGDKKKSVLVLPPVRLAQLPLKPCVKEPKHCAVYIKDLCEQGIADKAVWTRLIQSAVKRG